MKGAQTTRPAERSFAKGTGNRAFVKYTKSQQFKCQADKANRRHRGRSRCDLIGQINLVAALLRRRREVGCNLLADDPHVEDVRRHGRNLGSAKQIIIWKDA
jgi:hypothetical protein